MKFAVISDFDGTITTFDVGDFLLLHFNLATCKEIKDSYSMGVRIEEWMKKYFGRIKDIEIDKIKLAIKNNIKVRKGFSELVRYMNDHSFPIEVVSGGVDLYIDEVFNNYGIEIKGYYGKFNNGDILFDFLSDSITLSDYKAMRVEYYKERGYKTIFCGDAPNDFLASTRADIVFATLRLKDILNKENRSFNELNDFNKVMEIIDASISY